MEELLWSLITPANIAILITAGALIGFWRALKKGK